MAVLDRPELQASPLADLHAIADQLGLEGFRRLRKADLIDAILNGRVSEADDEEESPRASADDREEAPEKARTRRRSTRTPASGARRSSTRTRSSAAATEEEDEGAGDAEPASEPAAEKGRSRSRRSRSGAADGGAESAPSTAEGVVELLGNGSAFLRVNPPEPSDGDVYISAAQVRRCELVSGDRVSGPVRTPRRSERYPSLVRVEEINGASADAVSDGARYEDLPVAYAGELLTLRAGDDPTLEAIERLAPLGRGSRAVIFGPAQLGKTETLRRISKALSGREELELTLVLCGTRPEEIAEWQEGPVPPVATLTFAASADSQGQAVEQALDVAKRVAARKGHAVVLIDNLDGLHPQTARKALSSARNLREGGSLTIVATATRPFGGESTLIALDLARTSTGVEPILDLAHSGTLRPELLVGERGAQAIVKERAAALAG
jgi:transcription termination factor Rho